MRTIPLVAAFYCGVLFATEPAHSQTNLECVGYISDSRHEANDVAVSGHYLFLANGNDGLRIYDISTPSNPVRVGHTNDAGNIGGAHGIALFGDYAYVANSNDGMRIYDVSDPTHPINVGQACHR